MDMSSLPSTLPFTVSNKKRDVHKTFFVLFHGLLYLVNFVLITGREIDITWLNNCTFVGR